MATARLGPLRRTPAVVLAVACVVAAGALWSLYAAPRSQSARERDANLAEARAAGPGAETPPPALVVESAVARRSAAPEIVELAGVTEPLRDVWVASEAEGRILEVAPVEHRAVERDALLVRLDDALARAALLRAQAAHKLAGLELERQRRLGDRAVSSRADLDRAEAEERNAYAALLEARTRLERTRITAPFSGVVTEVELDPGSYVRPGDRIARILEISEIEIEVGVNDRQVGAVAVGDRARLRIDALGGQVREAHIVHVGRASDDETRRFPIVVRLTNPEGDLLPGMLVTVELEIGISSAIRIPNRCVQREFELDYVYVLEGEPDAATVHRRAVRTRPVPFRSELVEITSGLEDGERVAVSGIGQLRDGLRVRYRPAPEREGGL